MPKTASHRKNRMNKISHRKEKSGANTKQQLPLVVIEALPQFIIWLRKKGCRAKGGGALTDNSFTFVGLIAHLLCISGSGLCSVVFKQRHFKASLRTAKATAALTAGYRLKKPGKPVRGKPVGCTKHPGRRTHSEPVESRCSCTFCYRQAAGCSEHFHNTQGGNG